jgi:hypothetical protein
MFSHFQQLLPYIVLCLVDQFSFQPSLGILMLDPLVETNILFAVRGFVLSEKTDTAHLFVNCGTAFSVECAS